MANYETTDVDIIVKSDTDVVYKGTSCRESTTEMDLKTKWLADDENVFFPDYY